jgi:phage minor structural protein, N-terminal domain protein|nr:MAG TPA: tail protein [Caudoviricetes sp.]
MAYPILYKANETNFEHLGVSVLSDASKCYVSRERNGIYILEFDYPVNGKDVDKIKEGMIVKADAGYRTKNQRFIVSKITKTQNDFKIYCQHVSQVKTTMNAIRPDITLTSASAVGALTVWRDNLLDSREEFFVQSDISTLNSTTWKVENIENARDALGGKAGSILDVWGGEYEFDNLNITLHKSMGIDNPTIIAYGKNLLDLEQEQSILETYTSVFPFKKYTDDNNREQLITLPEILLDSTHLNKFTHRRILKIDFSSDENLKTVEQLRSKAKSYIKSNNVGVPKTNLKINYQDLSKVEGIFDNPALEQIDLCDRLKVYYNELGILNENAKVVKVIWDVILEENHEIEVGDSRSSFTDSTSAKLESLQAQNDSVIARINALVAEQEAAYDRFFKEKSKVIEDKVKDAYEKALLSSEEKIRKMGEAFDEKLAPIRTQVSTTVENYNRQFQATNLEISKNRVEATKQIQALSDRVNNIQDISNNETVRELRGLVNGATSKVTELETSITREFTDVKKKNEDSLNAVKAEFTKGVDGLTSKISSLEEYKNQDESRTENLKQWIQNDTASQLSRERTEINRIIDNKGFVKNTEFSSKFTESAREITNQLTALENYKNQDGVRTANLQIWVQNNTANQLATERRSIERWVNNKRYITTSVVENKVQETANSFSREISNVRESIPTSVGGRNYILNSNFAKDLESWEMARLNNSGLNWQKGHAITNFGRGLHIWGTPNGDYKGLGTMFNLTAKQGEKLTLSMDLGKDALNNNAILFIGLHYIVDNNIVNQEWQTLDLATQNFEVRKYKRITKTFTIGSDMNRCRLMIHTQNNKLINFYIDNIKLEKGNIATDWTPAPEDDQQSINELNSWKQTTTGTLNTVTSTLNDTVRHSQLQITADSINFGSNKVFDGRNLASMLSVSPDSIKAITDRLVITPTNENLVLPEHRDIFILNVRNGFLNRIYGRNVDLEGEYQFKISIIDFDAPTLYASMHVKYKDGTDSWFNSEFPTPNLETSETSTSVKVQVESIKEIEYIEPLIFQNKFSDFFRFHLKKLFVGKKKSAELIVDGSIEGRHVKANTLETGHHKARSITSEIIAAKAVKVGHLLVDDAMIDEFVAHKAFINKLWAQDAFIKNLQTVNFDFTRGSGDYIQSTNGNMKWDLNNNSMILKSNASIEFKESGNVLFRRYNGQTTFLNFVNDITYTESSVVLGGNRNNTFDPNAGTFVGMRIFPKTDKVSFLADKIVMSGGVGESNGFYIDVLKSRISPVNTTSADIYIGSKSGGVFSLRKVLANIIWNLELLHNNKANESRYTYTTFDYKDIEL